MFLTNLAPIKIFYVKALLFLDVNPIIGYGAQDNK